jgi:hypothetical protein
MLNVKMQIQSVMEQLSVSYKQREEGVSEATNAVISLSSYVRINRLQCIHQEIQYRRAADVIHKRRRDGQGTPVSQYDQLLYQPQQIKK